RKGPWVRSAIPTTATASGGRWPSPVATGRSSAAGPPMSPPVASRGRSSGRSCSTPTSRCWKPGEKQSWKGSTHEGGLVLGAARNHRGGGHPAAQLRGGAGPRAQPVLVVERRHRAGPDGDRSPEPDREGEPAPGSGPPGAPDDEAGRPGRDVPD